MLKVVEVFIFSMIRLPFKIILSREIFVVVAMAAVFLLQLAACYLSLVVQMGAIIITLILFAVIPLLKLTLILILITIYSPVVMPLVKPVLQETGSSTTKAMFPMVGGIWKRLLMIKHQESGEHILLLSRKQTELELVLVNKIPLIL